MNRTDESNRNEELLMVIPLILEDMRGPSLSTRLLDQAIEDSIMETQLYSQTMISAVQFMNDPDRYQYSPPIEPLYFSDPCKKTLENFGDIGSLEDREYWLYLHVSRDVTNTILENITRIALKKEQEDNMGFHNSVMKVPMSLTMILCFWYLRHSDKPLEEAARLSNLDISMVPLVIARGMKLLYYLNEYAKMCWPASDEFRKTADAFLDHFNITNVVGVITHHIFTPVEGNKMLLQVLNDQHGMVKFANVTYETCIPNAIAISPDLYRGLCEIPKGYRIVTDEEYKNSPFKVFFTPSAANLSSNAHKEAICYGERTVQSIINRFPRLVSLINGDQNAVLAACILHNICQNLGDY